ncbi:MAG: hypothetical protein ABGX26_03710 [Nautiliaceae bacterium]
MRKSIALLITLMFLFIVISILGFILNTTQKSLKTNNIPQENLLIKNSIELLNSIKLKTLKQTKEIFKTFPIQSKKGDLKAIIEISPIFNKPDINAYLFKKKINPLIDTYLTNILETYDIKDPIFFKNIILDTLDKDSLEREADSEIILQNNLFQNGKIYNKKHFLQILNYYVQKTNDKNILKIPWDNLIFFGNGENNSLTCEFLNKDVKKYLNITDLKCDKKNNLDIINFKNQNSFWVLIKIEYIYHNIQNKIRVTYDIRKKKVINIEANPLY